MTRDLPNSNEGFIQHGGTTNAGAMAIGRKARAHVQNLSQSFSGPGQDDIRAKLDAVLRTIDTHGTVLPDASTAYGLVETIATEVAAEQPRGPLLTTFLKTLADQVKSVSVIAGAVTALTAAVTALF